MNRATDQPVTELVRREERRVACRALVCWDEIRRPGDLPSGQDVRARMMPAVGRYLFIVDLAEGAVFSYCGETMAGIVGGDPVGKAAIDVLPRAIREKTMDLFKTSCAFRKPLADFASYGTGDGHEVLYRHIIMPLGDDHRQVSHLMGAFTYKIVL